MATIRRREDVRTLRRRDGLLRYASNVTSQNGEDGILRRLMELVVHGKTCCSHCGCDENEDNRLCHHLVDVGAWDGKHLSNTYSLLVDGRRGGADSAKGCLWKGILVEADEERFQELQRLHEGLGNTCVKRMVSGIEGSDDSLGGILQKFGPLIALPDNFDFLCIDIDGSDYWVWQNLLESRRWRPKVVCIEFNPTIPNDIIYVPPNDDSIRHGCSLSALVELGRSHAYVLVETTLFNAFFVEEELYRRYLTEVVPDTSIEALHETTMGTSLYQLYDGTIKLAGCRKLLWHRLPIDEESLQVVPVNQRQLPFAPQGANLASFDASIVVDTSSYCRSDDATVRSSPEILEEQQRMCSAALLEYLLRDGFCYVRGTGIAASLCRDALQVTNAFLQEADESVRRSCLTRDRARRGYSPSCTENFASLLGKEGPNDLVRKFRLGPPSSTDDRASSLLQPNVWPTAEDWELAPRFRSVIEAYYRGVCKAAHGVVEAICAGLLLERPELARPLAPIMRPVEADSSLDDNVLRCMTTSILTLLGYRAGSRHKGKNKGPLVAAHTDVGVITVLLFDDGTCAKLQRRTSDGWVDVTLPRQVPDDPIFVINVADCLSELSGGRLPSTVHRVVASGTRRSDNRRPTPRNCCALFVGLDPIKQLELPGGEKMPYEEWRKRRIARAQGFLCGAR